MVPLQLLGDGLTGSFAQIASSVAALVLVMMLVAMGGIAYRHFNGGIEWPEDTEEEGDVRNAGDDEEWDYY
jgi:hypothetical protein